MFDTHNYIKILKSQGVKENQAETIVKLVSESRELDTSRLATKEQIAAVEKTIKLEIEGMKLYVILLDKKFEVEMKNIRDEVRIVLFWVIGTTIGILCLAASVLAYIMPLIKH